MTLFEAKNLVFEKKPAFKELYQTYGKKLWEEYVKDRYPKKSSLSAHSSELIDAFSKLVKPLLGEEKTSAAIVEIFRTGFVSTADHHGILCHPFFANSALLRHLSSSSVISLTCGGISLSNSSFPRGIFFHDQNGEMQRIALASLRGRRRSVYGLPSVSQRSFEKALRKIETLSLPLEQKEKLSALFKDFEHNEAISKAERYSDELTVMNSLLWEKIFPGESLVYLESESLVREILLSRHLENETVIHKILFHEKHRESYLTHFKGIAGAHDDEEKGSELFWYIDEIENARKALRVKNGMLVTDDRRIEIALKPDIVREYLLRFELVPTMAFTYSILSFYYGLTLGGGFSQIQYLGDMKEAYKKTLEECGDTEFSDTETDIFTGEFVALGIKTEKKVEAASLLDLYLWSENPEKAAKEAFEKVSVEESLDAMMEEFVEILFGGKNIIKDKKDIHASFEIRQA